VYDLHDSRTSVQTDHPLDRNHSIASRGCWAIRLSVNRARIAFDNRSLNGAVFVGASIVAKRKTALARGFLRDVRRLVYAAGRSSAALLAATDFPGSGTANKMAINPTNATSDHKLSTKKFSSDRK
jgi:hypothetical protein